MFAALQALGVDLTDVFQVLETEGVEKFEKSWNELLESSRASSDAAPSPADASGPARRAGTSRLSAVTRPHPLAINPLRDPRDKRLPADRRARPAW